MRDQHIFYNFLDMMGYRIKCTATKEGGLIIETLKDTEDERVVTRPEGYEAEFDKEGMLLISSSW